MRNRSKLFKRVKDSFKKIHLVPNSNYSNENEWNIFRDYCLEYSKNLHENALKKYLNAVGFKDTFVYEYSYSENKFIIYTKRPGVWIGKGGAGVKLLKEILAKEINKNCDVEFIEIRGNFVTYQ